jgi:hypothetical protein
MPQVRARRGRRATFPALRSIRRLGKPLMIGFTGWIADTSCDLHKGLLVFGLSAA